MKRGCTNRFLGRFLGIVLPCCLVTSLSGCVLVPFIQAFREVGATENDRMSLLNDDVKKFNAAVVWGSRDQALTFVAPESQLKLSSQFKDAREEEKIVDSKVDNVTWADSAREATVSVKTRFYKVPVYVVNTRIEEQRWVFTTGKGWKITDRTITEG